MCNPISISRGEQSIPEKCCSRTLLIATLSVEQISDLSIELSRSAQDLVVLRGRWFGLLTPCWIYAIVIIVEALLFAISGKDALLSFSLYYSSKERMRNVQRITKCRYNGFILTNVNIVM